MSLLVILQRFGKREKSMETAEKRGDWLEGEPPDHGSGGAFREKTCRTIGGGGRAKKSLRGMRNFLNQHSKGAKHFKKFLV